MLPDDQSPKMPEYLERLRNFGPPFPAAEVERILRLPEPFDEKSADQPLDDLYFVAMPLLGEFRERRTFPLFLELCRRIDVEVFMGDLVTEMLPAMLAGT